MANIPSHATVIEAAVSDIAESSDSKAELRQFGVRASQEYRTVR
jgi:hypothetical protein